MAAGRRFLAARWLICRPFHGGRAAFLGGWPAGFFLAASDPGRAGPPLAQALRIEAGPGWACRPLKRRVAGRAAYEHCQRAISLRKLADWGLTSSQPVCLIQDNPMKYTRAPKFQTVGSLMVEPLVDSLNGQDHDYSPWFTMKSGSMGCPPSGRSTVMEMRS